VEAVRCGKIGACEKFHKRISDKSGLRIRRRENAKRHAACNAKKRKICAVQPTKLCPGNPFTPRSALSHEFDQFNPFSCRQRRYALNCSFFGNFRLSGSSDRKVSKAPPEEISEAPGAIAGISGVTAVVSTIRISIRCNRPPNLKTANSSKNNSPTQEPKRITTVEDAPSGMPPTCKTPTPLKSPKSPQTNHPPSPFPPRSSRTTANASYNANNITNPVNPAQAPHQSKNLHIPPPNHPSINHNPTAIIPSATNKSHPNTFRRTTRSRKIAFAIPTLNFVTPSLPFTIPQSTRSTPAFQAGKSTPSPPITNLIACNAPLSRVSPQTTR